MKINLRKYPIKRRASDSSVHTLPRLIRSFPGDGMPSTNQVESLLGVTQDPQKDEEALFMQRLKSQPWLAYFCQEDVIHESPGMTFYLAKSIITHKTREIDMYKNDGFPIRGIDLGDIKHYCYLQLQEITESFDKRNIISVCLHGRLLKGCIKEESRAIDVIVKTWDFFFPLTAFSCQHLDRIHDEINLLRNPLIRSHPNVVKLIGFHCDRRLAVIYEGGPKKILRDNILSDKFRWEDRLEVAIGIGSVLQLFHENGIVHGGVDSSNILVDEKYCPKIFNFRVFSHFEECHWKYTTTVRRSYGDCAEDYVAGPVWSMRYDIFAYGVLLLELVTKQQYEGYHVSDWIKNCLRDEPNSVLHESFCLDEVFASKITMIIISCLSVNSDVQPAIKDVVCELMEFVKPNVSNKRQKICN